MICDMKRRLSQKGFTLLELLVVISIIGVFSAVISINFNDVRKSARDDIRKADLQQLQVALELYKAQYGYYPAEGCGANSPISPSDTPDNVVWDGSSSWTGPGTHTASWGNDTGCPEYISGLVPDFIAELPTDPNQEFDDNHGYIYRVSATGDAYKVLAHWTVESDDKFVKSFEDRYARCPMLTGSGHCSPLPQVGVYAIYSFGAETW
jgi:prepilin-type N-terminal cleavage/methylation domain-containing protein